jgi:branched-chain amino acid transport system permease protein
MNLIQYFVNGLAVGGLYALIALGYAMVFSILKFVNFAHGDIYMMGAYITMILGVLSGPLRFALPLGLIGTAMLSVWIYHFVYQPAQNQNRLILLISAVAVSLFLENVIQVLFSAESQPFPFAFQDDILVFADQIVIRTIDLWMIFTALSLAMLTWIFVYKSKMGSGIRAIASNRAAAIMIGIPVDRLISVTFMMGAALATVASVFQSLATNQLTPIMGVAAGLKAFAASALGGTGSLWGAVIGGFFLGISESILIGLGLAAWKDSLAFVLLIFVLLVRPQGLLGQKLVVKI